ncbi:hypothetical protein K458DRAFT_322188 [Lentithecium fluviatile CBS 122367]|uniref:Acid protease n=1 Tax=Lentithecium fluviatile CBS 122367 TaxID=1168545 RepID=A0A6G1IE11_9PLEO|nr:hypothetical protein K458DRAFT_322188 [Lentithecium fluviatile CBS 122367]
MVLSFVDTESALGAGAACHGSNGGLVITSHETCNLEGERAVYKVHGVRHGEDGMSLELSVAQQDWERSFDRFEIGFGHTKEQHNYRQFKRSARRAEKTVKKRAQKTEKVNPPDNVPENVNQVTFDLGWKLENKTFDPAAFMKGLPAGFTPLPNLSNMPIEFGCKKCETKGQLVLSQGSIVIDVKQIDVVPDFLQGGDDGKDISSVITGGFMEIMANGMEGYFELFARPKANGSFSLMLFGLPVLGFFIPGIGHAGAVFEASLSADFEIAGKIEITYGMKLAVPTGSTVRMELTNIANSGLKGFPETTMTPLPFNFDISDVEAFVSLAMLPSVPIGFKFQSMMDASISLDMELPRLDAQISMVKDVDMNCNYPEMEEAEAPVVKARHLNARQDAAPFPNETDSTTTPELIAGPLVHIETNASMLVELGFDLAFPVMPAMAASAKIFSTATPLPTMCLVPTAGFKPASEVYAKVTNAPVGTGAHTIGTAGATAVSGTLPVVPTGVSGNLSVKRNVMNMDFLGEATGRRGTVGWQMGFVGVGALVGALMVVL